MSTVVSFFADPRRASSEAAAFDAERAWSAGDHAKARDLFAHAAGLEEEVAREVPATSPRVRSVLAISAVSLWYKAGSFDRAKRLAYTFLANDDGLTTQGRGDLEKLVDRCSREGELAALVKDSSMIPVEVKLDGGSVGVGYAPATAAKKRREAVTTLLMRAADLEANLPYRERGGSDLERDDAIQIFEVPAVAASYGLRFYVATGKQQVIASEQVVTPERVVERFLAIASAAAAGPEAVRAAIPDDQYARSFVTGFGEIAPNGEDVETVACSSPSWKMPTAPTQVFTSEHRAVLKGAALPAPPERGPGSGEKELLGTLATVHLGRSGSWIGLDLGNGDKEETFVMVDGATLERRVTGVRGQRVSAIVKWAPKRQRYVLQRIAKSSRPEG